MSFAVHLPAALGSAGVWNIIAVRSQIHGRYETTLVVKLLLVAMFPGSRPRCTPAPTHHWAGGVRRAGLA